MQGIFRRPSRDGPFILFRSIADIAASLRR